MFQSYKYRIYPNKAQEEQITKTFGCVRWVYNHFLDSRAKQYKSCGKTLNSYASASGSGPVLSAVRITTGTSTPPSIS